MSLYKQKGSEIWWVRLFHQGQRVRRSTGTTDRAAAEKEHLRIQLELLEAEPALKGHTWGKAVDQWVNARVRSDSELLSLAKFGRVYKDRQLVHCTRESFHEALAFCKTDGTYTRYRTMIVAILNLAKESGWMKEVPKLATKKAKKAKPREWITVEQWERLKKELPAHMKPMAELAIETGLRQANVLQLRWSEVSIERRLAWVEAEDTKGAKAIAVPLNDRALEVLRAQWRHREHCKRDKCKHEEFVFVYRGAPITEIKTAFIAACVRAELGTLTEWVDEKGKVRRRYEGFTWHGFRHTWATWHVQNGTPLEVLQKLGAWSDLRMVMTYAHHAPGFVAGFVGNTRPSTEE